MRKWIAVFLLLLILQSSGLYAQCIIDADAGPDVHICNSNIVVHLHGNGHSASGQLNFQWYGSGGTFSSSSSQNTTYTITPSEAALGIIGIILSVTDPVTSCLTNDTLLIYYGACPAEGLITGIVFNDLDSNGVQDPGENGIAGKIVENGSYGTLTNYSGYYELAVLNGSYQISVPLTPRWTASTPLSRSATVSSDTLTNYNFGIYLTPNLTDVSVNLISTQPRPGFTSIYTLYYENEGSTVASGTIEFKYDPNLTYNSSSPAHTTHDSFTKTLTYTYSNLLPGEHRYIYPSFSLPAVAPIGITLTSSISITPLVGDVYVANNYDTLTLLSVGSFDPNDKQVKPVGANEEHYIRSTDDLVYTIRFQNTGTAEAYTIVITDTLENTLDVFSLRMAAASHPCQMKLEENKVVKWIFENIMLPDSTTNEPESHGFVRFKIKQKTGNPDGTEIRNSAAIYFDFNVPVITNSTLSTIGDHFFLTASLEPKNSTAETTSVYPTPATDHLYIDGKFKVLNYEIISISGRTLAQGKYIDGIITSSLDKGIYVMKITTETGTEYQRVVIQ